MRWDYLKYAIDNVLHRKMRSWLTILSILIGITAIYALISFGQGLSNYVSDFSSDIGADKLIIQAKGVGAPGTDSNFNIERRDMEFLAKLNGVQESVGMYAKSIEIESDDVKKFVFGISLPPGNRELILVEEFFTVGVTKGRQLRPSDRSKVVLGHNYQLPDKIFPKPLRLRDKLTINGERFEIVGFYEVIGNPQDDSNVYLSEEAFESLFPETIDKFQFGIIRSSPTADTSLLAEQAQEKLRKFKDQDEGKEDFFIQSFEQAIETFNTILVVINAILVLIAFVSVIVAAVNIANTMYTSVLERTKEIGIMKSIGAKNNDILLIFLFESGILGLVGGILGVLLGFVIATAGGVIISSAGFGFLTPAFPWWLTVGSLLFAFLLGAISGLLPARQASKLKPVDALRYE